MRILFTSFLLIHGLIHFLGIIKAFSLADLPEIDLSVSKPAGLLWLGASLLFVSTAITFYMNVSGWWAVGLLAVVLSQGLIISIWGDAKFATIPNLVILIVLMTACANWLFDRNVETDIKRIMSEPGPAQSAIITGQAINDLPPSVQRWMERSGAVGQEQITRVSLKQIGEIRTEPGQEHWVGTEAKQIFNVAEPAFVWSVDMKMIPGVYISGRDLFVDGKGHMLIKLYSMISVVDETGDKIDRGTLQRFLSEIVWFPTAAVNDYITWTPVDSTTALATISWHGLTEAVTFHFSSEGDIESVTAERYMGGGEDAVRRPWKVEILEIEEMNNLRIPAKAEVSWQLDTGTFTWYRFSVSDIEYERAMQN